MIGEAFELALNAHSGQTDKAGMPYIGHVARVTAGVNTDAERIVALLHDVVEDCDVSLEQVASQFGHDIAASVDAITRRDDENSDSYYARVRANEIARTVKLSDIADNSNPERLCLLDDETRTRLSQKYSAARAALS